MGLPVRQRRVLDRIECTLRGSDPRLAALYAIFSRLTRDEEMPRIEQVRYGVRRAMSKVGHIFAAITARRHIRLLPRQPVVLLLPLVLALAVVSIVLVARAGPGCEPVRQTATIHAVARTGTCRPATISPVFGR
jgi:hypothetical protein